MYFVLLCAALVEFTCGSDLVRIGRLAYEVRDGGLKAFAIDTAVLGDERMEAHAFRNVFEPRETELDVVEDGQAMLLYALKHRSGP